MMFANALHCTIGVVKGDARSLDCVSYRPWGIELCAWGCYSLGS